MLRNWLTYKLREQVMLFERKAYHSPRTVSFDIFKAKYNQSMALEIKHHFFRYKNENSFFYDDTTLNGIKENRKTKSKCVVKQSEKYIQERSKRDSAV